MAQRLTVEGPQAHGARSGGITDASSMWWARMTNDAARDDSCAMINRGRGRGRGRGR